MNVVAKVVVRFDRSLGLQYEDSVDLELTSRGIGDWRGLEARFPGIKIRKLIRSITADEIQNLADRAPGTAAGRRPALFDYFAIYCPRGVDARRVAQLVDSWSGVERAELYPESALAAVHYQNDPEFRKQLYLHQAPFGINVFCAWQFPGGDGQGMQLVDVERGWHTGHPDFGGRAFPLLHGLNISTAKARQHGTGTLGVVCAADNAQMCVGAAPNIDSVRLCSIMESSLFGAQELDDSRVEAIAAATLALSAGDVLLIELQLKEYAGWKKIPIEAFDADFDAIRLAVDAGIVVIQPAGNGGHDLADIEISGTHVLNGSYRDSGAIVVGATTAQRQTPDIHKRFAGTSSNYGDRVDCYAWGENVTTLSGDGAVNDYFDGTSAAAAIIAAAAVNIQGIAATTASGRKTPAQLRSLFNTPGNGTPTESPEFDRVGEMPDLARIIKSGLGVGPDVYLRDHVGDTGDPHVGAVSLSPDIIVRHQLSNDAQADFGAGSGVENDALLSEPVIANQPHTLYLRLRNRGAIDATDVTVRLYWSEPSTLLTPDQWNSIGAVVVPAIPTGDQLTVSPPLDWQPNLPSGHYCFIAEVKDPCHPLPPHTAMADWSAFVHHVRQENNVTWRNFNVVEFTPAEQGSSIPIEPMWVITPGAPDEFRPFRIEVLSRLPAGAELRVEVPEKLWTELKVSPELFGFHEEDSGRSAVVPAQGRHTVLEGNFPVKWRGRLGLHVTLPGGSSASSEIAVRQLYREHELGRVTWRLSPDKRSRAKRGRRQVQR